MVQVLPAKNSFDPPLRSQYFVNKEKTTLLNHKMTEKPPMICYPLKMVLLPVEDPWRREAVRHPGEHSAQRVPRGPAAGVGGRHQQLRHHHPERPQGRTKETVRRS